MPLQTGQAMLAQHLKIGTMIERENNIIISQLFIHTVTDKVLFLFFYLKLFYICQRNILYRNQLPETSTYFYKCITMLAVADTMAFAFTAHTSFLNNT